MSILAIDPGTCESGWCVFDGQKVIECGVSGNEELRAKLWEMNPQGYTIAMEMIACYGMPAGKELFETCLWIGRYREVAAVRRIPCELLYRQEVKLHLCNSARAKDPNVRQALIDRFEPTGGGKIPQIGTVKQPGPLYGVSSHVWAALAVAVTFQDTKL